MKQSVASVITLLISLFLLAEGIWGFFSPVVFGILTTNRIHATIHVILGIAGLIARYKNAVKGFFGFLGSLLVVVALLWWIPVTRSTPTDLLNINWAVTLVNFVVGLLALSVAVTDTSRRRFGTAVPFPRR